MRKFLQTTDFGPIDPLRPPSSTNPPLVKYTKIFGQAGMLSKILYNHLRDIYPNITPENKVFKNFTIPEIAEYEKFRQISPVELITAQRMLTATYIRYSKIIPRQSLPEAR